MDFHGDGGSMNHTNLIEYIQKQLPADLTNLVNLQKELAERQGAMSAVQNALADRETAAQELATAKEQAAALVAAAKDKNDKAKIKLDELTAREAELADQVKTFNASSVSRETALAVRESTSDTRELQQRENQARLDAVQAKLTADQALLDSRVKDFQAKVAALTA
jgi:hypothetical protein